MTISPKDLEKVSRLAYLQADSSDAQQLNQDINSIMDFVEQLRQVDTQGVQPLYHPFALHQRLRPDVITEKDCIAELEAMAPLFDEAHYLVPKVLEAGK